MSLTQEHPRCSRTTQKRPISKSINRYLAPPPHRFIWLSPVAFLVVSALGKQDRVDEEHHTHRTRYALGTYSEMGYCRLISIFRISALCVQSSLNSANSGRAQSKEQFKMDFVIFLLFFYSEFTWDLGSFENWTIHVRAAPKKHLKVIGRLDIPKIKYSTPDRLP